MFDPHIILYAQNYKGCQNIWLSMSASHADMQSVCITHAAVDKISTDIK